MVGDGSALPVSRVKDGRAWRIGTEAEVGWIAGSTEIGVTITSAIPPVFDAYATVVVPDDAEVRSEQDRLVLDLLAVQSVDQPWWLGYLETGGDDVVFLDAPRVTLYADWRYVLVEAGMREAVTWRHDRLSWRGAMPDLVFPADRSWLLSRLWDDDWRCLGGPTDLVERFAHERRLEVRRVGLGEDATPPGRLAH